MNTSIRATRADKCAPAYNRYNQRPHRAFTDDERAAVLARYAVEGAISLAVEFGRHRADIVGLAQRLGLRRLEAWTAEQDAAMVEMRTKGMGAKEISDLIGRSVFAIYKRIESLGLSRPKVPSPPKPRNISVEVHWAMRRVERGEHGWPPELTLKQVDILESLRTRGPQSRRALALSIGEPPERDAKRFLMSHNSNSAIEPLRKRGLVARLTVREGRSKATIYMLTEWALANHGKFGSVAEHYAELIARREKR